MNKLFYKLSFIPVLLFLCIYLGATKYFADIYLPEVLFCISVVLFLFGSVCVVKSLIHKQKKALLFDFLCLALAVAPIIFLVNIVATSLNNAIRAQDQHENSAELR